jgi:Transmembrane secretion effector
MIMVTYRIRQLDRPAFLAVLGRLSEERRGDGAYAWGVSEDAADPERVVEWFFVESWAEHLRQHRRVSMADASIQAEARRFHQGADGPAPPGARPTPDKATRHRGGRVLTILDGQQYGTALTDTRTIDDEYPIPSDPV